MKHFLHPFLAACLFAALNAFPTVCRSAATEAPPDYGALINGLFDQAASCGISGHYVDYRAHIIDFTTPDAQSLGKLREMFLREKPRYLGPDIPPSLGRRHTNNLCFSWKNAQGKELGRVLLLEGDMLVINDRMLFTTSPPGGKSVTLETSAADFACQQIAAERKLPKPDYEQRMKDVFSRAASCKITGHYAGYRPWNTQLHPVNFATSEAAQMLKLREMFLWEKPHFVVNEKRGSLGSNCDTNLYFTWFDAQGKTLCRVALLEHSYLFFADTLDIFNTSPPEWVGNGQSNTTLFHRIGFMTLPQIYGKADAAAAIEAEKQGR
ncbi:hypothetical protein [Prosthecobacter sp.]|uniref:hypothetical protein n=1 Tax=Prosthecobacter sp. TaxID=1965333 RepID=UPI0037845CD1